MSFRIAFDLDGVLADMDAELVRQAEILFGEPLTRRLPEDSASAPASSESGADPGGEDTARPRHMTALQQRQLWRHVESIEGFWEHLPEIEPGAVQRLAAVASHRRWEVIFLTKRPETAGATAQVQTQRWLEAHGFALPSVYVVQGSRGSIAAALGLDIVVDDRPENCLDVAVDSTARPILVWRDDAKPVPPAAKRLGIGVVTTVAECLEILTQVDTAEGREQPGVMTRVMRLLGLKESTPA